MLLSARVDRLVDPLIRVFTPFVSLYDAKLSQATKVRLARAQCIRAAKRLLLPSMTVSEIAEIMSSPSPSHRLSTDELDKLYIHAAEVGCPLAQIAALVDLEIHIAFSSKGPPGKEEQGWRDRCARAPSSLLRHKTPILYAIAATIRDDGEEDEKDNEPEWEWDIDHVHTYVECLVIQAMWNGAGGPNSVFKFDLAETEEFKAIRTRFRAWQPPTIQDIISRLISTSAVAAAESKEEDEADEDDDEDGTRQAAVTDSYKTAVLRTARAQVAKERYRFLAGDQLGLNQVLQVIQRTFGCVPFASVETLYQQQVERVLVRGIKKRISEVRRDDDDHDEKRVMECGQRFMQWHAARLRRRNNVGDANQIRALLQVELERIRALCLGSVVAASNDDESWVEGWLDLAQEAARLMLHAVTETVRATRTHLSVLHRRLYTSRGVLSQIHVTPDQRAAWRDVAGGGTTLLPGFYGLAMMTQEEADRESAAQFIENAHSKVLHDLAYWITHVYGNE
jgi:hypothetical protein